MEISAAIKCPVGCDGGSCNEHTGWCLNSCIPGRMGPFCCPYGYHGSDCTSTCLLNCFSCISSTYCIKCYAGYYGNTCAKCPGHCTECSQGTLCSVCDVGYFGTICTDQCPPGCKYNQCEKVTGTCHLGCRQHYYGLYCSECKIRTQDDDCIEECSHGCIDGVCSSNGTCTLGCKSDTFTGDNCYIKDGKNGIGRDNTESGIGNFV